MSRTSRVAAWDANVAESVGVRDEPPAQRAPIAQPRDIGRRPTRGYAKFDTAQIQPDPSQPREAFDEERLQELAASLRRNGQLAPILVRWSDAQGAWLIVAGERRWRAAQLAGLETIDCRCIERRLGDADTLEIQLVENLLRENLRPMEEARGIERLMEQHGYSGKQVAAALAVPPSKVSRALALLKLPEDLQRKVDDGAISVRSAYELTKVTEADRQRRLARQAETGRLRHDDINRLVTKQRAKRPPRGVEVAITTSVGGKVKVTFPQKVTYQEVADALDEASEEVSARIRGRVRLY